MCTEQVSKLGMKVIPFLVKLVSHHPASPRHTLTPLATTIIKIQKHNTSRLLSFPSPFQNEQIGKMKHSLSYIMKLKTPSLSNITSRKFNQKSFAFHFHQNCCGYVKMHLRSIQGLGWLSRWPSHFTKDWLNGFSASWESSIC